MISRSVVSRTPPISGSFVAFMTPETVSCNSPRRVLSRGSRVMVSMTGSVTVGIALHTRHPLCSLYTGLADVFFELLDPGQQGHPLTAPSPRHRLPHNSRAGSVAEGIR